MIFVQLHQTFKTSIFPCVLSAFLCCALYPSYNNLQFLSCKILWKKTFICPLRQVLVFPSTFMVMSCNQTLDFRVQLTRAPISNVQLKIEAPRAWDGSSLVNFSRNNFEFLSPDRSSASLSVANSSLDSQLLIENATNNFLNTTRVKGSALLNQDHYTSLTEGACWRVII